VQSKTERKAASKETKAWLLQALAGVGWLRGWGVRYATATAAGAFGVLAVICVLSLVADLSKDLKELMHEAEKDRTAVKDAVSRLEAGSKKQENAFPNLGTRLAEAEEALSELRKPVRLDRSVLTLQRHTDAVTSVVFSPDGQKLASGSRDGTVSIWRIGKTGEEELLRLNTLSPVNNVVFSPDGQQIVAGCAERVLVWDCSDGTFLRSYRGEYVAFSPDGRLLAVVGRKESYDHPIGWMRIYDMATAREVRSDYVAVVRLDDNMLLGARLDAGRDRSSEATAAMDESDDPMDTLPFRTARNEIELDDTIVIGRNKITTDDQLTAFDRIAWTHPSCVVFSPDNNHVAVRYGDQQGEIYDLSKIWKGIRDPDRLGIPSPWKLTSNVAFGADGRSLVYGFASSVTRGKRTGVAIMSTESGNSLMVLKSGEARCVAVSRDGEYLAVGSNSGQVGVRHLPKAELILPHVKVAGLFSASLARPFQALIFLEAGRIERPRTCRMRCHRGEVLSMAFSPDGRKIVTGGEDGAVRIWDLGQLVAEGVAGRASRKE